MKSLVAKLHGNKQLGRRKSKWDDNIKVNIKGLC
jgi:hypothetical protein